MRVEPGKRHPDEGNDGERETCKRVELDWTEVRGVAALDISVFRQQRTKVEITGDMNGLPRRVAVRGGGSMLYGIISALNQVHFANDSVFANTGYESAQFPTPAPDRPLSTR